MQRAPLALLPLAVLLAPTGAGQDAASRIERFELFNACRPMILVVERPSSRAAEISLTEEALQVAAESRLRAARLYTEDHERANFAFLYVHVNVAGPAFSSSVRYRKKVTDEFGITSTASTWEESSHGMHGKDAGYIVSNLSRHLDRFLAAYLRVNESACGAAVP